MNKIVVKRLEIQGEKRTINRLNSINHVKRTVIAIIVGAVAGMLVFYLTEGKHLTEITAGDWFNGAIIGAFFGFFFTNSPCARGRC